LPTGPWPGAWINTDAALTTPMMTRSELTSGHDIRSSPSERPPNARFRLAKYNNLLEGQIAQSEFQSYIPLGRIRGTVPRS
jgi:hypothetical protein